MTSSRRRPKRQRTPTTIYTDDNPTTFTTKKKKGQNNGQHDNDDDVSRRSSTGNSSTGSPSWAEIEESTSMPPPAPVVKRGPGRPPSRRKSVEKILSLPGGKTRSSAGTFASTKKAAVPDSLVSSSSGSISTPTAFAAVEAQPSPATVTKRKRGRPPKNRPKEIPSVDPSTVESDPNMKVESDTKTSIETTIDTAVNDPSTTDSQDADPVVDETDDADTNRRRSLPESSTEPIEHEHGTRSRRSLDTLLSSKKDVNCSVINKSGAKVGSTRIPNVKRRTKSASSKLLLRGGANSSVSWTPPQQDIEGIFVNHSVTLAPILPPVLIRDNDDNNDATNENGPLNDGDTVHNASESSAISHELKSKYPVVFDKGVPKASSCIAPPFASASQISSGTSGVSSSRDKFNQSQHQLSQLPTWTPLYNPPVFFEDDYDEETGNLDVENTIPVTRHITAMTVRKPDHDYLVLGDSVGFVTIYSLSKDNITLPIAQLESMACQQRGKAEQERLRADLLKRKKQTRGKGGNKSSSFKFSNNSRPGTPNQPQNPFASGTQNVRSIVIDTSDTTIHALGMIQNRVVLATSEELECMDVPSGTSLWVCPLSANRFVTSLDMHLNTFDVLVSCSKTVDEAVAAPVSPLMLLQHSEDNVEICDANSPMLVRSPSCTAIWDIGASNRLLFIALSANRQEHELVLVSGGSIDSWKVACKTKIPTKASSSAAAATKLSQSPGGIYTLVASSRGIRLYQTESLQLIHVYGDQFTLHGQSVMWKDCWLAGSFFSEKNKNVTKAAKGLPSQWLQCDDWLGEKIGEMPNSKPDEDKKDDKTPNLAPYIIGVPHTKGPKELCENLHIWKVEHPSVVPMMSIPLPHKAEGALGLMGSGNQSRSNNSAVTEDRIVLVTDDGQGHLLTPKMESNFAGIVYPPGYQVVTDNIEYIEDEEATDQPIADNAIGENDSDDETEDVDIVGQGDDDEMDEELREAMRQSLLEHTIEYDEDVDIWGTNDEKEKQFLPCRPEPYLRQMVNAVVEGDETPENEMKDEKGAKLDCDDKTNLNGVDETKSSKNESIEPILTDAIFISNVLQILPNMPKIKPLREDCLSFTTTKVVVAVNPVVKGRGRKSRAANLETQLKASINPYLQSMMLSKQGVPVNGSGSKLRAFSSCDKSKTKAKAFTFSNAGTERSNGEVYSTDSSAAGLHVKTSSSPRHAANDEEAAVVMGLLGLSPCHTPNVQSNTFVSSDSKEAQNVVSAANGQPKGSSYLNSSSLSLLGVKNDQVVSALSSDRGSATEGSEAMGEIAAEKPKFDIIDKSCGACRGRLVIHSCGKRSLPIDYEELAKAERDRKEKEEEEKKRIRAEKRRLADHKRREAKKKKERELEEQRLREENERLEAEQRRRIQEEFASQAINSRREQIVASYANYTAQPAAELRTVDYSRSQTPEVAPSAYSNHNQFSQPETNATQYPTNGQAAVTHQTTPLNPSTSTEHDGYSMPARTAPLAQAAMPSVSATLDAVDALSALAGLAGSAQTLPESRREPIVNQYNVPAFPASHGFSVQSNVNDAVDFSGEVKRGIPSYATIRDQYSSAGSPNDVASGAMTNSLSATSSFYNGNANQTGEPNYSWSRPENR